MHRAERQVAAEGAAHLQDVNTPTDTVIAPELNRTSIIMDRA
jgi:hypothetical protein